MPAPQMNQKGVVFFAKSECPTPKQRGAGVLDDPRKGSHMTQGRFFSRKNSNTNMLEAPPGQQSSQQVGGFLYQNNGAPTQYK